MNTYNVHIYREMRLYFPGVRADSPEAAAEIVRERSAKLAHPVEDCDGETFAALVDVAGDEEFKQTRIVEFEGEKLRNAAPRLLEAAKLVLSNWESGSLPGAVRELAGAVKVMEPVEAPATVTNSNASEGR